MHVVLGPQHRCTAQQALARRAAFAVGRVDAGDAQRRGAHAGGAAEPVHRGFGVHPAPGARRERLGGSGFAHPAALPVPIDPAGGAVHQRGGQGALRQRPHQGAGARVQPPVGQLARGRRGQMQHPCTQPRQAAQAARIVQVARQGRDALRPQRRLALGRGAQGEQAHTPTAAQRTRRAQPHVAAANDQDPFTPEACGQSADEAHASSEFATIFVCLRAVVPACAPPHPEPPV